VVEFGTYSGGSALFFSEILRSISPSAKVLSIDIDQGGVADRVRNVKSIELLQASTTSGAARHRIQQIRSENPGSAFFILDSDHMKDHVLGELLQIRSLTQPGDYVVVEDGNINGHPVLPDWGPGPFEALEEYFAAYPSDYRRDTEREGKFGFTFAPSGFLIRQ